MLGRETCLGRDADPAVHLTSEVPGRGPGTPECLQHDGDALSPPFLWAEAVTLQEAFSW